MDLCSCLSERSSPSHDGTVVAQRAGWDRPVKEERQTLMNGPQQEELSSGLQQQDAIWPRSRQLPEINAIPSVPPSLFNNNSLSSSLWDKPRFPSYFCIPFPALFTLLRPSTSQCFTVCVSSVPLQALSCPLLCLSGSASLCNPCVSCCLHLPPPTSLSLSSVAAQSVSECTKHSLRLV